MLKRKKQNKTGEKPKKKTDWPAVIMAAIMMIGWYIFMFPTTSDLLNKIYNQNSILSYNASMVNYTDEQMEAMLANVDTYNAGIYEEQKTSPFHYRGPNASDKTYESVPVTGDIGTLRIPSIDVEVAVGHGTKDALLQAEAGHLYGTSLPSDKENVHAVIAAHSALSTAKLFTDLNKVKKGDVFYITILNQEYEYKVDQIKVVLPEDDWELEQVEEGENYTTLYTCTPYGVNTHRLLVRGKFIKAKTVEAKEGGFDLRDYMRIIGYSSLIALIILAPFILALIRAFAIRHKNNKKNKNKGGEVKNAAQKIEGKV